MGCKQNPIRGVILILLFDFIAFIPVSAQQSIPKQEQIHQLVRFYVEELGFNGNVVIAEEGKIIYENSAGWADLENSRSLSLATPFYLASVSKQFTSMAIMILAKNQKLDLDDHLSKYFPELGNLSSRITIRNLLTHTSGLPDYIEMGWDEPGLTNAQMYENIINNVKQLNFRPGHKYKYSNSGYVLLSLIVEKVSGIPFYKFIDSYICKPLGMENTWVFDLRNSLRNDSISAIGYRSNMKKRDDYYLLTTGDGGMYSSIEDLYIWDRALYTDILIDQEELNEMFEPFILANGTSTNYGFGWGIGNNLNGKTIYHSGGLAGFRTYIERQIDVQNSILILNNNSFNRINEMRNILVKIMDERPYEFPDK